MSAAPARYDAWLSELGARRRWGARDRLGTANLIDGAARARAASSAITGRTVGLARPLDGAPGFDVAVSYTEGPIGMGADHIEIDCHGRNITHLDSLNHIALDSTWYNGWAVDDPEGPSVAYLARHGLFTRGVLIDVPAARGASWADAGQPVSADDIERALRAGSVSFEPGDALMLYMGRDAWEAEGHEYVGLQGGSTMPGVGESAARWIAEHDVSMLCWDFLDSNHPSQPFVCVHRLIWAIGLLLVDNCDLGGAARAARDSGRIAGALTVAPLAVPGGTGCAVTPLWIQ